MKGQVLRDVKVPPPALSNLSLGVALRWCPTHPTIENVYHVLDVAANSPAARAGLRSQQDYIVGTPEGIVRGETGMSELIEDHLGRPLKLYVFNAHYNTTRQVIIVANKQWGGQGSMGCGIGFGGMNKIIQEKNLSFADSILALHRLPRPLTEPPERPGQTLFESPQDAETPPSDFFTGAQLSATVDGPSSVGKGEHGGSTDTRTKPATKKKTTRMTAADIEAMAAEADVDSRPASVGPVELPPPPKVTSPLPNHAEERVQAGSALGEKGD